MKKRNQIFLWIFCLVVLTYFQVAIFGDSASAKRLAILRETLKKMPQSDQVIHAKADMGGLATIDPGEYDLGTEPLIINSAARLDGGAGNMCRVKFWYSGKGLAIRFASANPGNPEHQGGSVANISVYSTADGIGPDTTSTTSMTGIRIEHVALACKGVPLRLRFPVSWTRDGSGLNNYRPVVKDVYIRECNGLAMDLAGRMFEVNQLDIHNCTLPQKNAAFGTIQLEGSGSVSHTWVENSTDEASVYQNTDGVINYTANHFEPRGASHLTAMFVGIGAAIGDNFGSATEKYPITITGGTRLCFTVPVVGADQFGGPTADISKTYITDAKSKVVSSNLPSK